MRLSAVLLLPYALPLWAARFDGPFNLDDGVTFYVVNPDNAPFEVRVRWHDYRRESYPRPTLVRILDPAENLILRHEFAGEVTTPVPWDEETFSIPASGAGVYQVVVVGHSGGRVELVTEPELEFGVFGHLQWLCGAYEQFSDAYFYLPPGLDRLPVEVSKQIESLTIRDAAGAEALKLDGEHPSGTVDLPPDGPRVWRLSASGDSYRMDFKGLPIILCPGRSCAEAIAASVDVMPDGTLCFHKHQVAAWELLQQYKRRPASDYEVPITPLDELLPALLTDPARNQLLFGNYGVMALLPAILRDQCLAPGSPWFGSTGEWLDERGEAREGNPLADYDRRGLEALAALGKNLAAMYWLQADFNPYHHNGQLLNRIVIAALLDLMVMREGEYVFPQNVYYFGNHGFALCHSHSGAFSLVYKDAPEPVRAVWLAGQRRLTDRLIYGNVGGCTNQWTVLLMGLWRYYEGTGDEWYKAAVLRNAHWLTSGQLWGTGVRPAGYMTEAMGPDATYNGITGHYLSYLYHATGDEEILAALRDCYELLNHTIVSEPEGEWLGSSGFCHRTPGDWVSPQYGAGLGPMANDLPQAGVRMPDHLAWAYARPALDAASRAAAEEELRRVAGYRPEDSLRSDPANRGRALGAFDILFANWQTFSDEFIPARLPCREEASFTRNFGDEFLCVKRPAYYAFLYAGRAYQDWQRNTWPSQYNRQFPRNDGLCLFWSPEFGVSLLSKNWGAAQGNTLLAEAADGTIHWPYYWATEASLDAANATATLCGKIHKTPLSYEREYRFGDEGVECVLTVRAEADCELQSLSECIPHPLPEGKPGGLKVRLLSADGAEIEGDGEAKRLVFTNASGHGHALTLAVPAKIQVGQDHSIDHYEGEHEWGRALIALPTGWQVGESCQLRYTLAPVTQR